MKIALLIMLTFYLEKVGPDIILTPQNVALPRGSSTELTCRANSGSSVSSWTFTPYESSIKDVTIYSREIKIINNVTSFRKITDEDEFLNIKTDSVQLQDAGIFTCNIKLQEGAGFKVVQRSAHLIVLDSDPNCSAAIDYSTDGREIKQLSCSVGFRGNWAPVMEWREGGSSGTIISTGLQSNTSSNRVSHGLTIPVDEGEKNTVSYTCVTFFAAYMSKAKVTATNIPNYTFIWPDDQSVSHGELPVPVNAAVVQGSICTMTCKTSSIYTVYNWTFTAAGSFAAVVIFGGENGFKMNSPRYRYTEDYASSNVSIEPIKTEDAGTYTCSKLTIRSKKIVQESAQLIVFESHPNCNQEEQQKDVNGRRQTIVRLYCTVFFRGNWAPLMEWRFNDAHGEIIASKFTAFNHSVTSILRLLASSTRQNAKYICRTFFGKINSSAAGSARNIPDYNHTWTSSVINESNDVSLVTLIVCLAVVVIAILVALIVYHMLFKRILAGRHQIPDVSVMPSFQTAQESEYAAIREAEAITDRSREQPTEVQISGTLQEGTFNSLAYSDLIVREDPPSFYYRELPSVSPTIEGSCELHPYANVREMVDSSTPSTVIRPDYDNQQIVEVQ